MGNFIIALEIMGLGMAGIFTVILLIMLVVVLLTRLGRPHPDGEQES